MRPVVEFTRRTVTKPISRPEVVELQAKISAALQSATAGKPFDADQPTKQKTLIGKKIQKQTLSHL